MTQLPTEQRRLKPGILFLSVPRPLHSLPLQERSAYASSLCHSWSCSARRLCTPPLFPCKPLLALSWAWLCHHAAPPKTPLAKSPTRCCSDGPPRTVRNLPQKPSSDSLTRLQIASDPPRQPPQMASSSDSLTRLQIASDPPRQRPGSRLRWPQMASLSSKYLSVSRTSDMNCMSPA